LVLHHGFGGWLETWYDLSYVDGLKGNYQLVLMDARDVARATSRMTQTPIDWR